jgi:tripartite-type tricarboxylate transporter receptor subunit TctC
MVTYPPAPANQGRNPRTGTDRQPPRGPSDFAARLIAPKLSDALGQNVVVDPRQSVNGIIVNSPDEFSAKLKRDVERFRKLIAEAGIPQL